MIDAGTVAVADELDAAEPTEKAVVDRDAGRVVLDDVAVAERDVFETAVFGRYVVENDGAEGEPAEDAELDITVGTAVADELGFTAGGARPSGKVGVVEDAVVGGYTGVDEGGVEEGIGGVDEGGVEEGIGGVDESGVEEGIGGVDVLDDVGIITAGGVLDGITIGRRVDESGTSAVEVLSGRAVDGAPLKSDSGN